MFPFELQEKAQQPKKWLALQKDKEFKIEEISSTITEIDQWGGENELGMAPSLHKETS